MASSPKAARYYDYFTSKDDLPFFRRLFLKLGGPVLDVGTGTGRVALDLANAGLEVLGVDKSAHMLDVARDKLDRQMPRVKERLAFAEDDMVSIELDRTFASILIGGDTYAHLLSSSEQLRCLRSMRKLLADKGKLVLEHVPPTLELLQGRAMVSRVVPVDGEIMLLRTVHPRCDLNSQRCTLTIIYEKYKAGVLVERVLEELATSLLFPREVLLLLAHAGFAVEHCWGDTAGNGFRPSSRRMIVVAGKSGDKTNT